MSITVIIFNFIKCDLTAFLSDLCLENMLYVILEFLGRGQFQGVLEIFEILKSRTWG